MSYKKILDELKEELVKNQDYDILDTIFKLEEKYKVLKPNVSIADIRKQSYETWDFYRYENYNKCPRCKGNIVHCDAMANFELFACIKCGEEFILDKTTEEITLK
jgi:DNA-directed RNA polymerase subunit RPC12/RpoP